MTIIFFGSSKYSTIVEKKLHESFGLQLVVTTPDRILSRKKLLTPTPVKQFATDNNIPVITAEKLTDEVLQTIAKIQPDFLVVADYGLLLPKKLLEIPKQAAINVHHSILPKYRGPSPATTAILDGEKMSGVTVMEMAQGLDTGDILAQKEYTLLPTETTNSLLTTLNALGASLLIAVLNNFEKYHANRKKQDETQATFTKRMEKTDGFIDLLKIDMLSALEIRNLKLEIARKVRAYYPWPGVWTKLRITNYELRIKLLPNHMVQPEGKRPMTVKDFFNGYPETKQLLERILEK